MLAFKLLRPEITINLQLNRPWTKLRPCTILGINLNPLKVLTRLLVGLPTKALLWLTNKVPPTTFHSPQECKVVKSVSPLRRAFIAI